MTWTITFSIWPEREKILETLPFFIMTSSCDIFLDDVSRKRIWNVVHDVVPSSKHHVRTTYVHHTMFPKGTHQSSTSVQLTSKVPKPQSDKLPILLEIHNMFARRRRGEEPLLKNTTFSLKVCFLLRSSFLDRMEDGMRHERRSLNADHDRVFLMGKEYMIERTLSL